MSKIYRVEDTAISLWNRFGDEGVVEWADETEQAIYRDAAQAILAPVLAELEEVKRQRDDFEDRLITAYESQQ